MKNYGYTGIDLVLIETLWNVKKSKPKTNNILTDVLIETLWNVKVLTGHSLTSTTFSWKRSDTEDIQQRGYMRVRKY